MILEMVKPMKNKGYEFPRTHLVFERGKGRERGEEEEDKDIELWMHSIGYGRAASKN